jgi:hemoglobin
MNDEFRSAEERRAAIVVLTQKETGIDETMTETFIRAFYARVRKDPLLAPIFESRISDCGPHLDNMFAFWSSLTLHRGRYHGQPIAKHMPSTVDAHHFDRWLALFVETARDHCPACRREAIHRARPPRRGEPGAWCSDRERRPSTEGRALSLRGVIICRRIA